MGRRAKNKQGDPKAFRDPVEHASPKGLGKRKADTVIVRHQPAKKIKDTVKSTQKHTKSANSKDTLEYKKGLQGDDSWNGIEEDGDGDSAGWEDIRDEDILPTQTRCVSSYASPPATYLTNKHHRSLFQDSDLSSSDASDSDMNSNEDEDVPITASNFAARSRALDARAVREAGLDAEELQMAAQAEADEFDGIEDMDEEEVEVDAPEAEEVMLQTAEQRWEEKKSGGPDVHVVQKRMRECVRILKKWKISGAKTGRFVIQRVYLIRLGDDGRNLDRARSEFVEQLVSDIAGYYGYNDFLSEKLFQLFPVAEVRPPDFPMRNMCM